MQSAHVIPPPSILEAADGVLAGLTLHERTRFRQQVERWWSDLLAGLTGVYPEPETVARRAVMQAAAAYRDRPATLKERDAARVLRPDWFQDPDMVGYAAYTERFTGPGGLAALPDRIGHLRSLGVTLLHLLPLLKPRPLPNDGGYAVEDYREVRSDLGSMADLREVTAALHDAGISLCLDLVLNHVAREHEWAVRARAGEAKYRDYFLTFPDRTEPDAYEAALPEIFPDFAPGSFTWDEDLKRWVWTTFNDYQWDLNWANPDVFAEMLGVILYLANVGVDVLRLDAIAFLWKRLGTNCQNQPEVHALTQALRAALRLAAPGVLFLAEAIVSPGDLVHYLGRHSHTGKVSDLAYHNNLMVQFWSMLASRDVRLSVQALQAMPPIPTCTTWLTYIRCHDDIGWAVDDRDAGAVGLSGFEHRSFLSDFYSGVFPGSFASGLVFQFNPETGDRRISGAAASLAGLQTALALHDEKRARDAVGRVLLGHALIAFYGGIPVLWYGDEVATLNDPDWASVAGHADDNRWVHRPVLDWQVVDASTATKEPEYPTVGTLVGSGPAPTDRVNAAALTRHGLTRILQARKLLPNLHGSVGAEAMSSPDPGVLAVRRAHPLGPALGLFNVTETPRVVSAAWLYGRGVDLLYFVDAISGRPPAQDEAGTMVRIPPYGSLWLVARPG